MPLVVRYVEPRRDRYPSGKHALPRAQEEQKDGSASPVVLPEEYQAVDKLLTVTSCLPILENATTNEFQAITIHRISSLIRQLSSLAQHAENVMGSIAEGLASCHTRSTQLEARIKRLTDEVLPSLDPELEAMDGFEIPHPDFQFKSRKEGNQFALTKHPPPEPLVLKIQAAHTPPLDLLSSLWPDGRNARHLYTNPTFFFEQWKTSMKRNALRRKSSGHILSPSSPTRHSKSNGIVGDRVSPVGGSKKLKRSATVVSRSTRKKTRPLSYHSSSNLSLQDVGVSSSGKPTMIQRSFSMRKSPRFNSYSSPVRKPTVKVPKSKHLGEPLSKTIAAVFPLVEVTVQGASDTESIRSEKLQRGSGLRRSFSLRRSRSRSKSPNPPSVRGTPDSVASGAQKHLAEDDAKRAGSEQPKKQMQLLEPGTAGTLGNGPTSTFGTALSLSNRSVTPLVSTPPNGQSSKGRLARVSSDVQVREPARGAQRSMTIAGTNPSLKGVAARVRDKVRSEGRPTSMNLDIPISETFKAPASSPLVKKATSQSSLNVRTPSSQSNSSNGSRPRSMFIGDIESPLPQDITAKLTGNSKSQSRKPRRPAPPRPPSQGSGGRGTPDAAKGRTMPTLDASPVPMTSLDASKADSDTSSSSPVPNDPSSLATVPNNPSTTITNNPEKTVSDGSPEKGQSETVTGMKGPPPPPQRCDSLSNTKTARGAVAGSGPATPGTAHTAQVHSSLDAERKQSMAAALSEVLTNMNRRSNPLSPTSPTLVNGGLNRVISPDKTSPLDQTLTPVDKTPTNKGSFDLDATLTPFDHSPHFGMSPINMNSFRSPMVKADKFTPLGKLPPSKRRFSKRQSSLYISPHKLSMPTSPEQTKSGFDVRADEILKAGGVANSVLEGSRSDLLVAIRKGIQLKKVEEEAAKKNDEVSWDVAAILERYEVLHSESEEESDYDDEWLDD